MLELLLHLTFMVSSIQTWNFYISEDEYTWNAAVNNPPCHIVGMNEESQRYYYETVSIFRQIILNTIIKIECTCWC